MNTNWSSPKTNIFSAMLSLRGALNSGYNAKLIKLRNEDCEFPITLPIPKEITKDFDFRMYKASGGYLRTIEEIKADGGLSNIEKHLALNYHMCFGTEDAMKHYYDTGELTLDNIKSMGCAHTVAVDDIIDLYEREGDDKKVKIYRDMYRNPAKENVRNFYNPFHLTNPKDPSRIKTFKRKVWVVVIHDKFTDIKLPWYIKTLNVLMYPLKFIPSRSVLKMDDYTNYTFRVGSVTNGFAIEFHIPKKFSFKD